MDRELLTTTESETVSRVPETPTNNEVEALDEQPQFRDLPIEPIKPPMRVKFIPPFKFDGKEYHELTFDFDSMTGKDFIRAERKFQALYKPATKNELVMPEMKHLYHDIILGDLAGVSHFLIQNLPRRYYVPLRTEALKCCGSSPDEEKE